MYWQLSDHNIKLDKYVREADALGDMQEMSREQKIKYVQRKLKNFEPEANLIKMRMDKYNPAFFEFTEYIDYLTDKFDYHLIKDCPHFIDNSANQYVEVMRRV